MLKNTNISNYGYTGSSPFRRSGDEVVDYILSTTDYDPFGMIMNGRDWNPDRYRFGFNGKESDKEVYGEKNSYDFGARIFDPRTGRFSSVDPNIANYPFYTSYCFAGNMPISHIDKDGKFPWLVSGFIGGVIGMGVKYAYNKINGKEFTLKDAASSFAGGFVIGSGAALIEAAAYSVAGTIALNGVNGALAAGFENTLNSNLKKEDVNYNELGTDMSLGFLTGVGGGLASEGFKSLISKIGDKQIKDLTKRELKEYCKEQANYLSKQLKSQGYKASGKEFKQKLNEKLLEYQDLKVSEINFVRATVNVSGNKITDISLGSIQETLDDKIEPTK